MTTTWIPDLEPYRKRLQTIDPLCVWGRITRLVGFALESQGPPAEWASSVCSTTAGDTTSAEVVGFATVICC